MDSLVDSILRIEISPEQGTFSIFPTDPDLPRLINARCQLEYRTNGRLARALSGGWKVASARKWMMTGTVHGDVECQEYQLQPDESGLSIHLVFGIAQEYPLVIWKVDVANQGKNTVEIDEFILLDLDGKSGKMAFAKAVKQEEMGFFSNGWQSWSVSQWYPGDGKMHQSKLGPLQVPMIQNASTPRCKKWGQFSSDFFAVLGDQKARTGALFGFLSQKRQFGTIYADLNHGVQLRLWASGDGVKLLPGESVETDWAVFNPVLLDHRDPLDKFTEAVAREHNVHLPDEAPAGWCSWYHFYTKVTAEDVQNNLKVILDQQERLPLQLVQIDDGFESQVGDWFSFKQTFPDGVAPLARKIQSEGMIPGLWLAPFIVHPDSNLMKEHPDWILRKKNGKPVNAGYVWGKLCTALDLTVPAALDYAVKVVRTAAHEWEYPYLKLDFLYAAALPGKYSDPTVTRAQVLRKGMEALRAAAGPQVFLLGCGAPLGSVLGLVEANRIGADVSGDWAPSFAGFRAIFHNEPGMPCARNSIRNIITRANLHRHWWMNDPDCLLVRPNTNLTLAEVRSLTTAIGLTGGSVLLSDDLPNLPPERLRLAEALFPLIEERARVLDWFDREVPSKLRLDLLNDSGEWHLVAGFNWEEYTQDLRVTPATYGLEEGEYWICDFWSGQLVRFTNDHPAAIKRIPPHGCMAASIRRVTPDQPQYLGSDLHISQGMELSAWNLQPGNLEFSLRLPRTTEGNVVLYVPGEVEQVIVNGIAVDPIKPYEMIVQIPVKVDGFANIELRFH